VTDNNKSWIIVSDFYLQIRVFEACKGKIYKLFGRGASLSCVQANDTIVA